MQHKRAGRTRLVGLLLSVMLALPMITLAQEDAAEIILPEVDPLSVVGDIAIAGSSTVEPVTVAMAVRFNDDGYFGNIAIAETGTSAGFERFCKEGSTDISNASRPIKSSELEDCAAIGREVLEFYVGIDALTVAVNQDSFVDQLTHSELIAIFIGEVDTWDQVNSAWPAKEIALFIPGTDSGTFDFFGEAVLGKKGPYQEREARFSALLAPEPTTSENDNTLIEGILGSEYAIGYFGFAYYIEHEETLRAVALADDMTHDDEGNWVIIPPEEWDTEGIEYYMPNRETAESGDYMLSRPLYVYSAQSILNEKPQVAAFINYNLTNAAEVVVDVGYFPLSTEAMNVSKQLWRDAVGE